MITLHVPAMTARADVRTISACISDVPGVRTLQADLATRTVQVTGPVASAAVTAAVTAAGYAVTPATDGSLPLVTPCSEEGAGGCSTTARPARPERRHR